MIKPYPHQVEGLEAIEAFQGRALVADPMGSGKSRLALMYCEAHPELRPVIVVCPASLKWNWEKEALKHFRMRSEILEGRKIRLETIRSLTPNLIIINYDILEAWLPWLKKLEPKIIILDECHVLANSSKRTTATKKLCKGVDHILALSGTPLTNRPRELWNILNILRPDVFKTFFSMSDPQCYGRRYCKPKPSPWGKWGYDFSGASRLDELHNLLKKTCVLRRDKEDILGSLPEKIRSVIPLTIQDKKQYQEAKEDFKGWLRKHAPEKVNKSLKAEAITQIGYLRRLCARLKMKAVEGWIDNFLEETDEKIILFMIHKEIVERLEDRYKSLTTKLTGEVVGIKRELSIQRFLKDPSTRIILVNIRAGGAGWDAPGVSSIAFIELDWAPGYHDQCESRAHGLNRGVVGKSLNIYYLVAKDTIEEKLVDLLHRKAKVINQVLDAGEGDDFDIVEQLMESIR